MPLKRQARQATYIVIGGNIFLLVIKALATQVSDSLAIFTETVNSLTDVIASIAVLICVRMAAQSADDKHPFGHHRAEPLAGLVVAIFTGIMGWEVLLKPLRSLQHPGEDLFIGPWALPVLAVTLLVKGAMTVYLRRTARDVHSPALRAASQDCRNDMLVASLAIVGVIFGETLPAADSVAALLISVYILRNAFEIGRENIDYLMGVVPSQDLLDSIQAAARLPEVVEIGQIKAHYVGTFIHVELDVHLDGELSTHRSHEIAEQVRASVEALPAVDRVFVHVEPHPFT